MADRKDGQRSPTPVDGQQWLFCSRAHVRVNMSQSPLRHRSDLRPLFECKILPVSCLLQQASANVPLAVPVCMSSANCSNEGLHSLAAAHSAHASWQHHDLVRAMLSTTPRHVALAGGSVGSMFAMGERTVLACCLLGIAECHAHGAMIHMMVHFASQHVIHFTCQNPWRTVTVAY